MSILGAKRWLCVTMMTPCLSRSLDFAHICPLATLCGTDYVI